MPLWTPEKVWQGQAAFLIGGGSSLKSFAFDKLIPFNTIGCNDAFRLGFPVCKVVCFNDPAWWETRKHQLERFPGLKVSFLLNPIGNISWLYQLSRIKSGLGTGNQIACNWSTGATAINLAINLGANRIYLLGYDLAPNPATGETHWHRNYSGRTRPDSFVRFDKGFHTLKEEIEKLPDVQVFNVTDGSSRLRAFPTISFSELDTLLSGLPAALGGPIVRNSDPTIPVATKSPGRARQGQDL